MARYSYLVISNPTAGQEAEFNRWYTEQHLPDVLKVPGFIAAQRFELAQEKCALPGRYVAIYEIESNDAHTALAALQEAVDRGEMLISDALDTRAVSTTLLKAITERVTA